MAQAKTLRSADLEQVLAYVDTRAHAARNRAMLLTHLAGLRVGEVACLRWSDVVTTDGTVKDEIRLLPDMTKGRHARTVFISSKLRAELQTYAAQAKCVDRNYPFFATQKSIKQGFSANSLSQTLTLLYRGAGLEGASSHSGRRSFLTNLANKGTSIHLLKTIAGHRNIQTTALYAISKGTSMPGAAALAVLLPTNKGIEPLTLSLGGPIKEIENELPFLLDVLRTAVTPFREAIKLG